MRRGEIPPSHVPWEFHIKKYFVLASADNLVLLNIFFE